MRRQTPVDFHVELATVVTSGIVGTKVVPHDRHTRGSERRIETQVPVLETVGGCRGGKDIGRAVELVKCRERRLECKRAVAAQHFEARSQRPQTRESKAELDVAV